MAKVLLLAILVIADRMGWYGVRNWLCSTLVALFVGMGAWMVVQSIRSRPLMQAAREGDVARLRELLEAGKSVNTVDGQGNTALHWAAARGQIEVATLLIDSGADVNAWGPRGRTPLSFAEGEGHGEMARLVRDAGGSTTAKLWADSSDE